MSATALLNEQEIRPGALRKPVRSHLRQEKIDAFQPPDLRDPDTNEMNPRLVIITPKGEARRVKCTKEMWVTVDGVPTPGRRLRGLEMRKDRSFIIYYDRIGGHETVVSFSEYPNHIYSRATGFPENAENIEAVLLTVDPSTGSIRVDEIPTIANTASVLRVIRAVDGVGQLYPGQILGNEMEVTEVVGNKVRVTPPSPSAQNTGYSNIGYGVGPTPERLD